MTVTTSRLSNGRFDVLKDGQATKYRIFNGSLGLSGNGRNEYGIEDTDTNKITWIGSLAKSKKVVSFWLK